MFRSISYANLSDPNQCLLISLFGIPGLGRVGVEYRGYVIASKGRCNGSTVFIIDLSAT